MNLKQLIGFDWKTGQYVIGSHDYAGNKVEATLQSQYTAADVDAFLASFAQGGGADVRERHVLLGQTIVEPIMQIVPYVEQFSVFYMEQNYGTLEDNAIPVEDLPTVAFETHQDGEFSPVRAGFTWTRPTFTVFDYAVEVPWENLNKAGWNFLARQMKYAAWDLARKRDVYARDTLAAAIATVPTHLYQVAGGLMTKVIVDLILKNQAQIGFPVQRVVINAGRVMDMAAFTWPVGFLYPPEEARSIIRTLYIGDYGGAQWYVNPNAPVNDIWFGGTPDQIGWHQTRGSMISASDVDVRRKHDIHVIQDMENAWYIGNPYTLARLTVTA